jgi:hypothetical protein
LLTFINDQNSSSVTDLEKQLLASESSSSVYRIDPIKFKKLNETLKKDISTKLFDINDLKSKILLYQKTQLSLEARLIELIDVKTQLSLAKKDIFTLQHKSGNDSNKIISLNSLLTEKEDSVRRVLADITNQVILI